MALYDQSWAVDGRRLYRSPCNLLRFHSGKGQHMTNMKMYMEQKTIDNEMNAPDIYQTPQVQTDETRFGAYSTTKRSDLQRVVDLAGKKPPRNS